MGLHFRASQLSSKEILLMIFSLIVVVSLVLLANWWMGGDAMSAQVSRQL
jgi:heme/copper-type cytochrome/quinol oxidase subunit 4